MRCSNVSGRSGVDRRIIFGLRSKKILVPCLSRYRFVSSELFVLTTASLTKLLVVAVVSYEAYLSDVDSKAL